MALTQAQVAALTEEFNKLQAEIAALELPKNLLSQFESLTAGIDASFDSLKSQRVAFNENAEAIQRLKDAINSSTLGADALARATLELSAAEDAQVDLIAARTDAYSKLQTTLASQVDTLKKAGNAQEDYRLAMEAFARGGPADMEEYEKRLRAANEAMTEYGESTQVGAAEAENLRNSVLGLSGGMQSLGAMITAGAGGIDGFAASMADSVASGELFLNMGLKMLDTAIQFALAQDQAISDFRSATGAGDEFNESIIATESALRQSGVELEEAAAAYRTLKNEVVGFTNLSKTQQEELAKTTALLAEMGFSLGTQADITQAAMQSMNMTVEESQQLLTDIASVARTVGMDVDKMGQQFSSNKEFIVSFGKDGAEVFEDMAIQAKSLGMELGTLTGVVDKFTTFDQAGQSVGRLNAILGGPFLNSIDMLNASMEDPTEAIKMLRGAVDEAGVSLEDMGRAQKMAMADALGMSIEDMTNMMGKSTEELEIHRIEQEELAAQAAETMSISQKLDKAWQAMYINMRPFIEDVIIPAVEWFGRLAQGIGDFIATGPGMRSWFALFIGLMVSAIALAASFALANMAAAFATGVGAPLAAGGAALLSLSGMAAFIGGAGMIASLVGGISLVSGGVSAMKDAPKDGSSGAPKSAFADGGVVGTTTAIVGERGPEMVEMPIGSRVNTAPTTLELTKAIKELSNKLSRMGGTGAVAVYIGDKEVTDVVLKAIDSPKGKRMFGTYAR